MSDLAVKQQLRRAIESARSQFSKPKKQYGVIKLSDPSCPFHLERFRKHKKKGSEVWKIRVTISDITRKDVELCRDYKMPEKIYTKFIAYRKGNCREFELKEILE